jgi:hypothetical protein
MLAGVETGVVAGLGLLGWQAAGSMLAGLGAWEMPLRLATAAFGPRISSHGFATGAAVGAALQLFTAGLVGALFGLTVRSRWAARRVMLLAILFGLGLYYLGYEILLRDFGLGSYVMAPRRSLVVAHLLFSLFLGLYPRFLDELEPGPPASD